MSKEWINNVAEIKVSKGKNRPYLEIKQSVTLKPGDRLIMNKREEELAKAEASFEQGNIPADKIDKVRNALSREFVKYVLHKAPSEE